MMPCECPNENFLCHAKDGCVCRQGYTGTFHVVITLKNEVSTVIGTVEEVSLNK